MYVLRMTGDIKWGRSSYQRAFQNPMLYNALRGLFDLHFVGGPSMAASVSPAALQCSSSQTPASPSLSSVQALFIQMAKNPEKLGFFQTIFEHFFEKIEMNFWQNLRFFKTLSALQIAIKYVSVYKEIVLRLPMFLQR
jgi:hypothetical protein